MAATYHFAVDLGATSGRTILGIYENGKVEMRELSRFANPMLPIGTHIFWDLPGLYNEILLALGKCARDLAAEGKKISTIGIDTWGCDVAYFYADGTIAGLPYCYRDSHTQGAIDRFSKKVSRDVMYDKTGIQFMDFNTLFQLATVKENNPAVIDAADKILFVPDALAYMLTGVPVTERTVASTSQILNPKTGELDAELLEAAGVAPSKFAPLVDPGHVIGNVREEVCTYLGIDPIPVVAVAGHDTASAVIAVPTPDKDYAYLSCGTWSLLGIESDDPIINEKSRAYNFTNEGGIDGTIRFLKNICGMWIFEQSRKHFKNAPSDVGELCALCLDSDCESIINPDAPDFVNPANMVEAINEYCRKTGQKVPETTADYVRVIFRSLAKRYKEILSWLTELSPVKINRLHVIGGGSRNAYLMQFTADELGIPVVAGPTECTALGNMLVQLRAAGEVKTYEDMRKIAINSTSTKTFDPKN